MIVNQQRRNKSGPNICSVEKQRLNLLQNPLTILKASIFIFLHKYQKRHECTIFHIAAGSPPTSIQVDYSSSYNPRSPKSTEKTFQMAQTTSQWRKIWSTDSPFLLHIQHLSTTMTSCFQRLSIVKIFPKAADQTKKPTLKGTLVCQTLSKIKIKIKRRNWCNNWSILASFKKGLN